MQAHEGAARFLTHHVTGAYIVEDQYASHPERRNVREEPSCERPDIDPWLDDHNKLRGGRLRLIPLRLEELMPAQTHRGHEHPQALLIQAQKFTIQAYNQMNFEQRTAIARELDDITHDASEELSRE